MAWRNTYMPSNIQPGQAGLGLAPQPTYSATHSFSKMSPLRRGDWKPSKKHQLFSSFCSITKLWWISVDISSKNSRWEDGCCEEVEDSLIIKSSSHCPSSQPLIFIENSLNVIKYDGLCWCYFIFMLFTHLFDFKTKLLFFIDFRWFQLILIYFNRFRWILYDFDNFNER